MTLPRCYPIVESSAWIRRLLPRGVKLVQLRLKDRPNDVIRSEVRVARDLCGQYGARLVINDHWQCALEEGCEFVHLGQTDLDTADVPELRRAGVKIGVSTHSYDELQRALAHDPDYIALGPIYPTTLKQMPWAPQGLARISEWKRLLGDKPLVAIGGLTVERLAGVFDAGADCAAVVSDIVRHVDPERRAREWLEATGEAQNE